MAIDEEFQGWEIEGGTEIVDANGFELADVPETAILRNWHKKYPYHDHWGAGAEGETYIERTVEEAERITRLLHAAPEMLHLLRLYEHSCPCGDADSTTMCITCDRAQAIFQRINEGGDE